MRARRARGGSRASDVIGKKTQAQTDPNPWTFTQLARSAVSWFKRGLRALQRRLQMQQPLPPFYRVCPVMRN
ncbi:hypothetical protein BN874_1620010 [Candidatus Contendobacter odensis Run_B_J11]|uniref:Uncharacterized protein n=1 Tax=Candidatus Contendobacter odensis Run_B_J11 TaxID=1400861 RepID=A0A7U7G9W6_9GAMM|nr:hypothetical protein BN874_1620010 [Candidatus Contendobacter odensis Run_B_J11]